jgi:hypothetical protein
MRLHTLLLSSTLICLPGMAQSRTLLRPIPLPVTTPNQLIKISFQVVADTNATRFQGMDAYLADGTFVNNWKIPAGKMLVLTDFSIAHYTNGRYAYDVTGQVECSYPNGASFTVFPIAIKAGQQHISSVHALTTGLAFSQPDGPSLQLSIDTLGGISFQSNRLWAFGYLTDAN